MHRELQSRAIVALLLLSLRLFLVLHLLQTQPWNGIA
jgi:hypothetical protein